MPYFTDKDKKFQSFLYFKENQKKEEEEEEDYSLFILNVPPHFSENDLQTLFQQCGSIKNVTFKNLENNDSSNQMIAAYLSFYDKKSLKKALSIKEGNQFVNGSKRMGVESKLTFFYLFFLQPHLISFLTI